MSVYSGFATRQLENKYNNLIVTLIRILQRRIVKFYNNEKADEMAFKNVIQSTLLSMSQLEQQKYNEPLYTVHMIEICNLLNISLECTANCACTQQQKQMRTFITQDIVQAPSFPKNQTMTTSRRNSTQLSGITSNNNNDRFEKKFERLQRIAQPPKYYNCNRNNRSFNSSVERKSSQSFYQPPVYKGIQSRNSNKSTERSRNNIINDSYEDRRPNTGQKNKLRCYKN